MLEVDLLVVHSSYIPDSVYHRRLMEMNCYHNRHRLTLEDLAMTFHVEEVAHTVPIVADHS